MVIITAGMIGVGKTTLTELVANHLGTKAYFEPVSDNPVLSLFYSNPKQYAFLLQIYFLNRRFAMIKEALTDDNSVLDRSIYEDALFTKQNHLDGNINDQEMDVYSKLLDNMMSELEYIPKQRPDLMVYADADFETILSRITKRGRDYEQFDKDPGLRDYYYKMWTAYGKWFDEYDVSPKIKINLQEHDLEDIDNQNYVLNLIDDQLKLLDSTYQKKAS